jgi:predicted nucleic acid-binding protein
MNILIDTNIAIEHFQHGVLSDIDPEIHLYLSVISEAEPLRFGGMKQIEEMFIYDFLSITRILSIDSAIARRGASIGRTRSIKLPDLLIAATAIEWNMPLFTRNIKDFRSIPGLNLMKNLPK